MKHSYRDGWAWAVDGKTCVLLDTKLTSVLKNEGIARDIVRNVQNLRKDSGLDIADRIVLYLMTASDAIAEAIQQCKDYIATETLAVEIKNQSSDSNHQTDIKIDGQEMTIAISKAM